MHFRLRESKWKYGTSASQSGSIAFIGFGSGDIDLVQPNGSPRHFHYISAGGGFSAGISVATYSTTDSFSTGNIYLLDAFVGSELTPRDIEGRFFVVEASAGVGLGGSAAVMLLSIPTPSLEEQLIDTAMSIPFPGGLNPNFLERGPIAGMDLSKAKALLVMGGFNAGIQVSAGILGSVGYLWKYF